MTHTIQLPIRNVSCEACAVVIGRILGKFPHAKMETISPDARTLTLTCEEKDVTAIKEKLREYNYLNESRAEKEHFWFTLEKILNNKTGFEAEHRLLVQTAGLAIVLYAVLGGLSFFVFPAHAVFQGLLPILALVPIGIALNAGVLVHVKHVRNYFTCSSGMMAGMIVGMISGFMSGAVLGATNGMFVGSVAGMAFGMSVSAYAVRKAGVMSVLEGLMAGLMAGTMGAMLSVMMLTDHLVEFLYILFGVSAIILGGMSYFMLKEVGPIQHEDKKIGFPALALASVLTMIVFIAIILWGPKSSFTWGGFS